MRAADEKDQLLALMRQQADELYRCNDDKQRHLDRALTAQLHMQLEQSAQEVCGDGFGFAPACLCAGVLRCIPWHAIDSGGAASEPASPVCSLLAPALP